MMKSLVNCIIILALVVFEAFAVQMLRAELAFVKAENLTKSGAPEVAVELYQKALKFQPESASYQRALGKAAMLIYNGAPRNIRYLYMAENSYMKTIEYDPLYPYGWSEMGKVMQAFRRAGITDRRSPEQFFLRSVEIDPANPLLVMRLIDFYLTQAETEKAKKLFLELAPYYPKAISVFGQKLIQNDRDVKILAEETRGRPYASLELADCLMRTGRKDMAIVYIDAIPESEKTDRKMAMRIAYMLVGVGRKEEAKTLLQRAFEADPTEIAFARQWADMLIKEKDLHGAIDVYKNALEHNPDKWELSMNLARVAYKAREYDLAYKAYTDALNSEKPDDRIKKEIFTQRGQIKSRRGDLQGALKEYQSALEIQPEDEKLQKRIKRLKNLLEKEAEKNLK